MVLQCFNDSKAFIEYSNDIDDIYRNIAECDPNKKRRKILISFDDGIADMLSNKKINPIGTESFIQSQKTKHFAILLCSTKKYQTESYALFCYESSQLTDLQQIEFNYSSDVKFENFLIYIKNAQITLSSGKIDKCEYFTGEEILPSDQQNYRTS